MNYNVILLVFLFILTEVSCIIVYVNETLNYPLTDIFGYLENPIYQIVDPNSYMSIITQYNLHSDVKTHNVNADTIISAKAQTSLGYWTNHFLFLEVNKGTYYLHYSENPQEENVATPKFDENLLVTNTANDICYDAEQYDSTHYIIDCAVKEEGKPLQNKFLVVSKEQAVKISTVSNPLQYQTVQKRKISTLYVSDQLYLLQGSIQPGVESIIQIYQIVSNDISFVEQEHEISSTILQILLGLDASFKFSLIDFKLIYDQIFVLDKTFICSLKFDKNGDWQTYLYIPVSGIIRAFDYVIFTDDNGEINSILVILKDKSFDLYYRSESPIVYTLPQVVSANAQIKLSHHFIIIEDENTVYQYSIKSKVLLNQKILTQVNHYLINPIYPDIISISYNLTRRYYISEGYLQIQSVSTKLDSTNFTIRATSNSQQIDYQLTLQVLDKNDGVMYQNGQSKQLVTDVLYQVGQTQDIIPFMSGPNIELAIDPLDSVIDLQFEIKQEMHIKEWPNPSTIHFQDMLQFNDTQVFVLFQLKNKEVQIWECIQSSIGLVESCKLDLTTTFPILTNQMHFQWWIRKEQAFLVFCDSDYTAELWKLEKNELTKINKIVYLSPITQLLELKERLYILVSDNKKIGVYYSDDATWRDTIDEKMIKQLGMIKSWNPKKLFGNQKYQSHLLFIQNNDNILLTIYNEQINLVECILMTEEIEITLFSDTFFLSKVNQTNSLLLEYSTRDLNNIYLMRSVQLYNYEFHSPLTFAQSEDNGFLFILTKSQQVLLFRPNQKNSNDELFRVFDVQFTDFVTMSACGYKKTHFYFSNGVESYYFAILMQTKLLVQSLNTQSQEYFAHLTQSFYFKNEHYQYKFIDNVDLLNRQFNISSVNNKSIDVQSDQTQQLIVLDQLFVGQVVTIQCDQCNKDIKLVSPINEVKSKFLDSIMDIEYYSVNYNAAITKDKLYLIDHLENVKEVFVYGTPNSCEFLQVQKDSQYVITLCNYNNNYHMYLVICDLNFVCQNLETPKDLSDLQGVQKMVLLIDNLVLIQDFAKTYVYHISITKPNWTLSLTQIIDSQKGQTDFVVKEYTEEIKHFYVLSIIDQADNLNIYYTEFQGSKLNILYQSSISIYNVILDNNQFAFKTTDYIQLFATQDVKYDELNFIIVANDVASVAISVKLNTTKQIETLNVTQVLNPYKDWSAMNKAVYFNNYLIIPFTNKVDILLGLYYFDGTKLTQNFIYGLKDSSFSVADGLLMIYLFEKEKSVKLYSNLVNKVMTSYEIRNSPSVLFQQTSILQDKQNITLTAENTYDKQSVLIEIIKISIPIPPVPDDPPGGSNWWWITLLVIGCVLLIGGGGVLLYMKFRKVGIFRVEEAGYSLHNVP